MSCVFDSQEHALTPIYTRGSGEGEAIVVRWCDKCGAVVVDHDTDGRTYPGYYSRMRFPQMALQRGSEPYAPRKEGGK